MICSRPISPLISRSRLRPLGGHAAGGFTLVEMLVTVALIAVLMLSVTQIFSIATRTISGGQAISAAVRDAQAAQAVMSRDFGSVANDGPCFIIRSGRVSAFRNNPDLLSAVDNTDPLKDDLNGDGAADVVYAGPGETYSPLNYNYRSHRLDYLMFFARDRYYRQTGNNGTLVANESSNEAAIYYHHLQLPDNSGLGAYFNPGGGTASTNPNNFNASSWILGREAILMTSPSAGVINDLGGTAQQFLVSNPGPATGGASYDLTPLNLNATTGTDAIKTARCDLAGTNITGFKQKLSDYIDPTKLPKVPNTNVWWTQLMCDTRFQANPFVTKPITSANASQQVPIFLPACTQFIVEFAGDYISQDPVTGAIDATKPNAGISADGTLDFVPATRQIRWYGLPRDTNGDGVIHGADGDVVPLRDVAGAVQPMERVLPSAAAVPLGTDYYGAALNANPEYTVAWPPVPPGSETDAAPVDRWKWHRPELIRITIVIDRPEAAGNLLDGQTFEYVFKVGI